MQLYRAIRAAELIVADCRCVKPGHMADPFVLYQLGLAQAVGKPIIVVVDEPGYPEELYPAPHFVYCDETDANSLEKLQVELVEQMEFLASYAILRLVAHDSIGITATCSDVSPLRPLLFDGFRTAWRTGLVIHQWSRDVAKHVHRLSDMVSDLEDDVWEANEQEETPDATFKRIRATFRRGLEKRFREFQKLLDGDGDEFSLQQLRGFAQSLATGQTPPQLAPTLEAFRYMEEKTTGRTSGCVRGAAMAFNRVVRKINRFCEVSEEGTKAFAAVRDRLANEVDPDKPLGELAEKVRGLELVTHDIDKLTVGMMSGLLEAIG